MPAPPLPYRILDAADETVAAFIKWHGTPPSLVQKQITTPSRPGYRNVGLIDTGNRLELHEVDVESWHESLEAGRDFHGTLVANLGIIPLLQLVWADLNLTDKNQKIALKAVRIRSLQMHPHLLAPKWELNYEPGAKMIQHLTIQYFQVDP